MWKSKHKGLIIGIYFTLISLLLTLTIFMPFIVVYPFGFIENTINSVITGLSTVQSGSIMITILSLLLILFLIFSYRYIRNKVNHGEEITTWQRVFIMVIFFVLIHPFGCYLSWGLLSNFKPDALYLFNSLVSFPFTSLLFVLLGFTIDYWGEKDSGF